MVVAVGVGIGAGQFVEIWLPDGPALVTGAVAGGIGTVVCLVAAWGLRVKEVGDALSVVLRRIRRG